MRSNTSQVRGTQQEPSIPVSVDAENHRNGSQSAYQERSPLEDPRVKTPPLNPTPPSNPTGGFTGIDHQGRSVASTTPPQLKNPPSLSSLPRTAPGKEPASTFHNPVFYTETNI